MGSTFFPSADAHRRVERGGRNPPFTQSSHWPAADSHRRVEKGGRDPPPSALRLRPAIAGGAPPDYISLYGKL